MEILNPIGVLVLAFMLGLVFFKQALSEKKMKPLKFIFIGTFIIAYLLILLVFYDQIKESKHFKDYINYVYFGSYVVLGFAFLINTSLNISKKFLYSEYYKCIEDEKLFMLIDKNDKIKEASKVFSIALENDGKTIIGERFQDVFDNKFSLVEINNQEFNNNDLKNIFSSLKKSTESFRVTRELKVYDRKTNKPYVLRFNDHIIVENGKYKGHLLIGDLRTEDQVLHVENELKNKETSLEVIRTRFKTNLELTEEAIFFLNLDDSSIWGNDTFVSKLHLPGNSIKREDFLKFIHKDDIDYYKQVMDNLNPKNLFYDINYRFKTGANYSYVREYGKRLYNQTSNEIMGYINIMETNHYERSNIKELDEIKSTDEMLNDMTELYKLGRVFEAVTFRINNIDDINNKYGRAMGNLVMSEYLKAIWKSFVEENRIYRVSGLEFTFIITDYRKMDLLKQALPKDTILHASMKCGSIELVTDVYMGIASSNEVRGPEELYRASQKALKTARMEQVRTNYIYYKDIK